MTAAHLQGADDDPEAGGTRANGSGRARSFAQWWVDLEPYLPAGLEAARLAFPIWTPELGARQKVKARSGWARHGGGIVLMSEADLWTEAENEYLDLGVYHAEILRKRAEL